MNTVSRVKECIVCKNIFRRNPKYSNAQWEKTSHCSMICVRVSRRNALEITCRVCGKIFSASPSLKRTYCSNKCRIIGARKHEPQNCIVCNKRIPIINKTKMCRPCLDKKNPTKYWLGKKRPEQSIRQKGRKFSEETKKRLSESHKGIRQSPQTIEKRVSKMRGELSANWKGGHVKHPDKSIRTSWRYKEWRKNVYQRDDWTCQACGQRGGRLNADHELPFAIFPDLRFEVLNGRTMCLDCHKKTDTYALGARKIHEFASSL